MSDVPAQGGLALEAATPQGQRPLMLFRTAGGLRAYLNVCPHMGRSLDFAPGEFLLTARGELVCPHHGACFELDSGRCVEGPCRGDALTAVAVEIREGRVGLADPNCAPTAASTPASGRFPF